MAILRFAAAGFALSVGLTQSASAVEIPKPVINIPKPVINIPRPNTPRPTINIPRPNVTVNVPHPTINVPRPNVTVQVPKPTVNFNVPKPVITAPKPAVNVPRPTVTVDLPKPAGVVPKLDVLKPAVAVTVPKVEAPHPIVAAPKVEVPRPTVTKPGVSVPKATSPSPAVNIANPTTPSVQVTTPKTAVLERNVEVAIPPKAVEPVSPPKTAGPLLQPTSPVTGNLKIGSDTPKVIGPVGRPTTVTATPTNGSGTSPLKVSGPVAAPVAELPKQTAPAATPGSTPPNGASAPNGNAGALATPGSGLNGDQPKLSNGGAKAVGEAIVSGSPERQINNTDPKFTNAGTKAADHTAAASTSQPISSQVNLPNGTFGKAVVNPDGTITVSNAVGTVTLTKQQMSRVFAGDTSVLKPLMANGPSASGALQKSIISTMKAADTHGGMLIASKGAAGGQAKASLTDAGAVREQPAPPNSSTSKNASGNSSPAGKSSSQSSPPDWLSIPDGTPLKQGTKFSDGSTIGGDCIKMGGGCYLAGDPILARLGNSGPSASNSGNCLPACSFQNGDPILAGLNSPAKQKAAYDPYTAKDGIEPYHFPIPADQGAKLVELGIKTAIDAKNFISDQAYQVMAPIYNGVNGMAVGPDGNRIYAPVPDRPDNADLHEKDMTDDLKDITKEAGGKLLGDAAKQYGGKVLEGVGEKVGDKFGDGAKKAAEYIGDKAADKAAEVVADKAVDTASDLFSGKPGVGEKPEAKSVDKANSNSAAGDSSVGQQQSTPKSTATEGPKQTGIPYYLDPNPPPPSISANPPPSPSPLDSLTKVNAPPATSVQIGAKP